jgi:hypothetical protein
LTDVQSIKVTVTDVNDNTAPNAVDDNITWTSSTTYNVIDNDSDPDGDTLSAIAQINTSTQSGGKVNLNTNGTFTYNPPAVAVSSDSFNYTLKDQYGATDTATVFLIIL